MTQSIEREANLFSHSILEQRKTRGLTQKNFSFIDLFAGIGGIRLGFERAGGKCVFSSEWDKRACETYHANFGEYPKGDITHIQSSEIPQFDVLCAGFPCQPFSISGKKKGFEDTRGTLFFEIERILRDKQPAAFMLENVKNLTAHNGGATFKTIMAHLESLGYFVYARVLNALDFGLLQKRERIIICGFKENVPFSFPSPRRTQDTLQHILESQVAQKYYVKEHIRESRQQRMKQHISQPYITHENVGGSITPHHFSCALRAGASANYLLVNNERRLTEREMLRLQGFPENYQVLGSYTQCKHQIGNSVPVPLIEAVAKSMAQALETFYTGSEYDTRSEKRVR